MNAKNASPWKDIPLLKANSSNHLRYCAKHMFNQGKILSGIKNNLQYFLVKLSK
ncbi:glycosyltransferase family 8 C-terminal domain-containing protein [Providencia hangzhouensis]